MELLFVLFIATGLWLKTMFLALNLILAKKQKFGECEYVNGRNKTNIKNRTYYFYNDIIDLDEFDKSKIKVDIKNLMTLVFIILDMNIRKKLQNVMK